jgi:hypothetical protein
MNAQKMREAIQMVVPNLEPSVTVGEIAELKRILLRSLEPVTSVDYAHMAKPECPVCGSQRLRDYGLEADLTVVKQTMECTNCDASWAETYQLDGYTDLEIRQ